MGCPTLHVLCEGWVKSARVMIGVCNFSGLSAFIHASQCQEKWLWIRVHSRKFVAKWFLISAHQHKSAAKKNGFEFVCIRVIRGQMVLILISVHQRKTC